MHLVALKQNSQKIFTLLGHFPNFYLAGGTALALQIGHRQSHDFDLFSSKKIPNHLLKKVTRIFASRKLEVLVNNADELTLLVGGIKITFLYYPFPLLTKLITINGVKTLGIKEIAATKAYTIGRRGSFKDYVDLFFILSEKHCSLVEIIRMAERKYDSIFNARLLLEQLLYFEDIQDTEILFLKEKVVKSKLKKFFTQEVKKIKL